MAISSREVFLFYGLEHEYNDDEQMFVQHAGAIFLRTRLLCRIHYFHYYQHYYYPHYSPLRHGLKQKEKTSHYKPCRRKNPTGLLNFIRKVTTNEKIRRIHSD